MDDDDQLDDFDMPLEKDAPIKLPMGDGGTFAINFFNITITD